MKLSDAIALGYSEVQHDSYSWLRRNNDQGRCEGCAIGAAFYAVGERGEIGIGLNDDDVLKMLRRYWPWAANPQFMNDISERFHRVMGKASPAMTIEELIDWVKQIEPAEPAAEKAPLQPTQSQQLCGCAATTGSGHVTNPATDEQAFERIETDHYDFSAGTR